MNLLYIGHVTHKICVRVCIYVHNERHREMLSGGKGSLVIEAGLRMSLWCALQDSWTPLHLALSRKDPTVVQAVLDHRPDVDMQDHVRNSVLYYVTGS